jgi:hypothetical protein
MGSESVKFETAGRNRRDGRSIGGLDGEITKA